MNLEVDEWSTDISNVTSVLKLWLRELPDPLFTASQHADFMEAASKHMSPSFSAHLTCADRVLPVPFTSLAPVLPFHPGVVDCRCDQ